ncbi:MAG: hypothetical protein RLZZ399_2264 [Verrucomicrobiota bacterium]|jgi:hypothetical protein
MISPVVFGIGLLLLIANLSLCAVFMPTRALGDGGPAARLRWIWRILALVTVQIGAWTLLLLQAGAAEDLPTAVAQVLGCFALLGGSGEALEVPWSGWIPFISLNGLLLMPVSLLSFFGPPARVMVAAPAQAPAPSPVPAPAPTPAPAPSCDIPNPVPVLETPIASPAPEPVASPNPVPAPAAPTETPRRSEPFRGSLPPVQISSDAALPPFPPERVGPTPPPIRFGS